VGGARRRKSSERVEAVKKTHWEVTHGNLKIGGEGEGKKGGREKIKKKWGWYYSSDIYIL